MVDYNKRSFLKILGTGIAALMALIFAKPLLGGFKKLLRGFAESIAPHAKLSSMQFITGSHIKNQTDKSEVIVSSGGTPRQNVEKVIEMMGGIQNYIGVSDIVILKPNLQWWNQGRTNLAAMKAFIDIILKIPGFTGEVIIAENHHFMDSALPEGEEENIRGWVHLSEINGDIDGQNHNINTMIDLYNKNNIKNISRAFWRDGGPKRDIFGNGQNGGIIKSAADGDGYVWTDDDFECSGLWGLKTWKVKMTYPVFTSKFSGITIDLKNGAFRRSKDGELEYLPETPVKLINFAVLNTHGDDTGITSAVKNFMGITDLSCGDWGLKPKGYSNVHECGERFYPYAKAAPIGYFMKKIRKADLNIVTAEWVGWGGRVDPAKAARMKTIIAGLDPLALDYFGAKHIIYPLTQNKDYHDPDNPKSSVRQFLDLTRKTLGEGNLDENNIIVKRHEFA
ncbi:MAG: DUF362 domain-containing protein [Calditrichaceae bacterium]